ncbi:MAG: type 11 methyltransferase [Flaviaesturariibacter sp.]|nr:type 11 methyltransferase [Flaviaesturariibacter sp.]
MDIVEASARSLRRHPWELARFEIVAAQIRRHLPRNRPSLLFDIGCGDCYFAARLLAGEPSLTVVGVEPAFTSEEIRDKEATIGSDRFHLFSTLDEALAFTGNRAVDGVLMLDVIEHIEDDRAFLKDLAARPALSHAILFIAAPAFGKLYTSHDRFLRHFRRYSRKALLASVAAGGFEAIESGYFFASLLPIRLAQKAGELMGRSMRPQGIGSWRQTAFVTNSIKGALLLDHLLGRLLRKAGLHLPGLSTYCLCKPRVS